MTHRFPLLAFLVGAAFGLSAQAAPLKVYILSGQSNMQGHAKTETIGVLEDDPTCADMLARMRTNDGSFTVCDDVWISAIGSSDEEKKGKLTVGFGPEGRGVKIGPEFTFGLRIRELEDGPVLIIKTAWGGKSLHTDFRSPSAGPFVFSTAQLERFKQQGKDIAKIKADKKAATGHYYRLMMAHVKKVLADPGRVVPGYNPKDGFELAGFVWFQGWNDMVGGDVYPNRGKPGGYDAYSEVLAHMIRDVRKELNTPKLPFVIGVMGAGGPVDQYPQSKMRYAGIHQSFRDAMAAPASLPEFKDTVVAVRTETCWDMPLQKLRDRDEELKRTIKEKIKSGAIGKEERAALEAARAETFNAKELRLMTEGVSNAEYHYLGSAKILGRIGEAFAEAVHKL